MGRKSKPPAKSRAGGPGINPPPEATDTNKQTPRFCLRHLQSGHDIEALSEAQRADFALALYKRARMTWSEIILADKHGLGLETMPKDSIKPTVPEQFKDTGKFIVLRYSGKLPMVGVRALDTFHIVWVESAFGNVYDHS